MSFSRTPGFFYVEGLLVGYEIGVTTPEWDSVLLATLPHEVFEPYYDPDYDRPKNHTGPFRTYNERLKVRLSELGWEEGEEEGHYVHKYVHVRIRDLRARGTSDDTKFFG